MFRPRRYSMTVLLLAVALSVPTAALAQELNRVDRERVLAMLNNLRSELKKNYFDPNYKGIDMETRFKQAEEKARQAKSLGQAVSEVAWALDGLNDSHTFLLPPERTLEPDYGWVMEMIGDACFITAVHPKSDAEAKGVKPGDRILKLNGYPVTRPDIWKMKYFFNVLKPQPALRLDLRSPDGTTKTVQANARMRPGSITVDLTREIYIYDDRDRDPRWVEMGEELMIWEMPDFGISESMVDGIMDKARQHKALIIDMRRNPGGYVKTANRLVSNFFEHEVKILERVGRKEFAKDLKPDIAKPRRNIFTGKLIVLVGAPSASAAEIVARVMQIEKRGMVIGDVTSGHVMQSRRYGYQVGVDKGVIFYGASITMADLIMADGKSLEHVGVTPDKLMLPTAADMAAGRDPVLAHAAELCGVKLTPDAAGKLFPVRWKKPSP